MLSIPTARELQQQGLRFSPECLLRQLLWSRLLNLIPDKHQRQECRRLQERLEGNSTRGHWLDGPTVFQYYSQLQVWVAKHKQDG